MGTAIILKNADFSGKNLGKVTYYKPEKLENIEIVGKDLIEKNFLTEKYSIKCYPFNSEHQEFKWEIIQGFELASIDNEGILQLNDNSSNGIVIIKASSLKDPSISSQKTVEINRNYYDLSKYLVWQEHGYWTDASPYLYTFVTHPGTANTKHFCTFDFVDKNVGSFAIKINDGWQIRFLVASESHPLSGGIAKSSSIKNGPIVLSSDQILDAWTNKYPMWALNISKTDGSNITLEEAKQNVSFILI